MAIFDEFIGTNGTGLPAYSSKWAFTRGSGTDLQIQSDGACVTNSAVDLACERTENGFPDEHYGQVTYTAVAGGDFFGPSARNQGPGTGNYYGFYSNGNNSYLFEQAGAAWTQMGGIGIGVAASDIARIEVSGTTLTPTKNGALLDPPGAQTDATYSGGKPGTCGNNNGVVGNTIAGSFEATQPLQTAAVAWLFAA